MHNKKLIILIISTLCFIILTIMLRFHLLVMVDTYLYYYLAIIINDINTFIMKFFSFLGSHYFYIGILIILFLLIKKKNIPIFLTVCLSSSFAINYILKDLLERARPNINPLVIENGFSYPSAHTMVSVCFYGAIIYLVYKYIKKNKKLIICFLTLIISGIGISRIYLGVHYFTDVLGGVFLGITLLMIIIMLFQRKKYI